VTLHSLRDRTLGVIPIRLGLGVLLLGAARLAGAENGPALLAFVIGVFGITFVIFNDPRARFAQGTVEPLALPAAAEIAPRWRQALAATIPSTIAVAVLAGIALVPQPTLAALLAGVEAGLGVAALLSLGRVDPLLYVDPESRVYYAGRPNAAGHC
jgi:hypothetical protein